MTEKEKKARAAYIVAELEKIYPDAACALESGGDPWRLLVMGRLSAQCTDARVNTVCRELFAHFPDAAAMAAAPLEEIEKLVYSCGVYKVKAKNIRDFSAIIKGQRAEEQRAQHQNHRHIKAGKRRCIHSGPGGK